MEISESHKEGDVAKTIEQFTSKLPSDWFLWGGLGLMAVAFGLQVAKQKHVSLMIGQLAAPILIMGLYNKTVKQSGHDYTDQSPK